MYVDMSVLDAIDAINQIPTSLLSIDEKAAARALPDDKLLRIVRTPVDERPLTIRRLIAPAPAAGEGTLMDRWHEYRGVRMLMMISMCVLC